VKNVKFFPETGWWFPDHEIHMIEWMVKRNEPMDGRLTYQYHKLTAAMKHVQNWRVAVDVGGHVGLWSAHLAKRFGAVMAFEPLEVHRECFRMNVLHPNVTLYPEALGESEQTVHMDAPRGSTGGTHVADAGEAAQMRRLDDYGMQNVDFMKLDCEGYELHVLRGAEETLKRCKPAIIVEQKPGRAESFGLGRTDAVSYLQSLGAKLHKELGGDFIMSWA
jgi:FkbM family methyltransferase